MTDQRSDKKAIEELRINYDLETDAEYEAFLEEIVFDSVAPGICMNEGCEFTADYEPDQCEGWCDECETTTVKSVLLLEGWM